MDASNHLFGEPALQKTSRFATNLRARARALNPCRWLRSPSQHCSRSARASRRSARASRRRPPSTPRARPDTAANCARCDVLQMLFVCRARRQADAACMEETSQNAVFGRCGLQGVAHSEGFCTLPVRRFCKTQCWQIGGLRKHSKTRRVANTGCRKYGEMQQRFCAWVSLIMTTRYTSWQTEERKEKL